MDKLNSIFNSRLFKGIESAVLIAGAYFLINYIGLPSDVVSTIVIALASALGVDGISTAISIFGKTDKKEEVNKAN